MIKRKWARAYISLMLSGLILSFILPLIVYGISKSVLLLGISILICVALVIAGGIIKLVFCSCPNCGSLVASNYVTYSSNEYYCPRCGKKLIYDNDDEGKNA
jgi:predicted RNA-binding Zn-ribbon protein involved in translation (DUF1610 family)